VLVRARVTGAGLRLERDLRALDGLTTVRPHLAGDALGGGERDGEGRELRRRDDDLPRAAGRTDLDAQREALRAREIGAAASVGEDGRAQRLAGVQRDRGD